MQYIIGLLILGAVLWYFLSEPFAASVDKAYEENTTWNSSTINDNKEAYIYSMFDKVDVIEKTLLDERLNLKIKLDLKIYYSIILKSGNSIKLEINPC